MDSGELLSDHVLIQQQLQALRRDQELAGDDLDHHLPITGTIKVEEE